MAQAFAVDWQEVKTLALAIGVREAARQMGLTEDSVRQRSSREGWLKEQDQQDARAEAAIAAKRERQGLSPVVTTAADVLARLGPDSRSKVAIGLHKGATVISEMDGQEVVMAAQQIGQTVKSLALVHGWASNHTVNVLSDVLTGALPNMDDDVIDV